MKQRFYVRAEANDDKAYLEAIAQAGALAVHDSSIRNVVLLVHTKSNTAWFDRLFGEAFTKRLFLGAHIEGISPRLKIETLRTFRGEADVVIACALDDKELFELDDEHFVKVIIAVPWQLSLLSGWLGRWSPTDVRGGDASAETPDPSCIVKKALESLTHSINMSTGIAHPSDAKRAKTYVRALHKYDSPLNSEQIASYLVTKLHWSASHAADVKKLIETLNNGRHFQGGERTGLREHYKRWKEACK